MIDNSSLYSIYFSYFILPSVIDCNFQSSAFFNEIAVAYYCSIFTFLSNLSSSSVFSLILFSNSDKTALSFFFSCSYFLNFFTSCSISTFSSIISDLFLSSSSISFLICAIYCSNNFLFLIVSSNCSFILAIFSPYSLIFSQSFSYLSKLSFAFLDLYQSFLT